MKKFIITLIVLGAIAGSVGAYYKYRAPGEEVKISKLAVARGDVIESVGATGTLQAVKTVQVGSQVSGNIKALYADFNSIVKKGQVVAELDPSLLQTQIEQARANVIRAQADLDRLKVSLDDAKVKLKRSESLAARKLVAPQELESAQVAVRSAEASIKSSEASLTQSRASLNQNEVNLQHTVIEAPIDGIVISRNVDVGQTVAASMNAPTLFIIAEDLTKMQVNANVDESDVGRIRAGQVVKFRVDAYPLEEFTGTVSQVRLQPIVTQNVVTYATVIDVPNQQLKLKPGMTANVTIEIARRERCAPRAERGPAVPAERRHVRGAEPGRAARDAARRGRRGRRAPGHGRRPTGRGWRCGGHRDDRAGSRLPRRRSCGIRREPRRAESAGALSAQGQAPADRQPATAQAAGAASQRAARAASAGRAARLPWNRASGARAADRADSAADRTWIRRNGAAGSRSAWPACLRKSARSSRPACASAAWTRTTRAVARRAAAAADSGRPERARRASEARAGRPARAAQRARHRLRRTAPARRRLTSCSARCP